MKIISDKIFWIEWLNDNFTNWIFDDVDDEIYQTKYRKYIRNDFPNVALIHKKYEISKQKRRGNI